MAELPIPNPKTTPSLNPAIDDCVFEVQVDRHLQQLWDVLGGGGLFCFEEIAQEREGLRFSKALPEPGQLEQAIIEQSLAIGRAVFRVGIGRKAEEIALSALQQGFELRDAHRLVGMEDDPDFFRFQVADDVHLQRSGMTGFKKPGEGLGKVLQQKLVQPHIVKDTLDGGAVQQAAFPYFDLMGHF